jgi:hypothetical protein
MLSANDNVTRQPPQWQVKPSSQKQGSPNRGDNDACY